MSVAVIVAQRDDIHAHAVRSAAGELGREAYILDIQEFTTAYDLATSIGPEAAALTIRSRSEGWQLDSSQISGLWWRRPYPPENKFRPHDKPHNIFTVVAGERRSALMGSLSGLVGNAFNDPGRSRQAAHKPSQLARARDLGLTIPETLITNSPDAVETFVQRTGGQIIYKMFNGSPIGLYGTRRLEEEDRDNLHRLQGCPAIFQEYIEGEYDIRVAVVGNDVFAARLSYEPLDDVLDTRFVETSISPCSLPPEIADRLTDFVAGFGLVYSAIDMRYSKERGYVFFESNPEGQYLWIEIEAGLPISRAIAERLVQPG